MLHCSKPQFVQKFQYNLYLFDQPHKNRPIQKTRFCCGLCIFRFVGWYYIVYFYSENPLQNIYNYVCILFSTNSIIKCFFFKFYGKVGVISWFLFHIIWKNYVLYWDFDLKIWIVIFSLVSLKKKHHKTTFPVKISV